MIADPPSAALPCAPAERKKILWLGMPKPKEAFVEALRLEGLELQLIEADSAEDFAPTARALLLPIPSPSLHFNKECRRAIQIAKLHGLVLGFVFSGEVRPGHMPAEDEMKRYFQVFRRFQKEASGIHGYYYQWDVIARELAMIGPQPGENRKLAITGTLPDNPESLLLVRRAFHDFQSLNLESLPGGKSGAEVWRVRGVRADGAPSSLEMVAKISTPEKIARERSACKIIEDSVPHRLYAPLIKERCLTANGQALATYHFLGRCDPLLTKLGEINPAAVKSLFEQTLRGLHSHSKLSRGSVPVAFGSDGLKAFRWTSDLVSATDFAWSQHSLVPGPDELQKLLEEFPVSEFVVGTVHGDLHVGNIFVPLATSDAVIIDYGSVKDASPLVADAACLEVSLVFTPGFLAERIPPDAVGPARRELMAAFKYPLKPSQTKGLEVRMGKGGARALRIVRESATKLDNSAPNYAVAVAAYLIRYAAFADNGPIRDRSVAYELATALIGDAAVDIHRRLGRKSQSVIS